MDLTKYPKSTWAALFTLLILWGLLWFIRYFFAGEEGGLVQMQRQPPQEMQQEAPPPPPPGEGARGNNPNSGGGMISTGGGNQTLRSNFDQVNNVLRDLLILLLTVLVLNSALAGGPSLAVLVLVWIYFFVAVVWAGMKIIFSHPIADTSIGFVEYALAVAIGALAFAHYPF